MKYLAIFLLAISISFAQAEILEPKTSQNLTINPTLPDEGPLYGVTFCWGGGFGTNYYLQFAKDTTAGPLWTVTLSTEYSWYDTTKRFDWESTVYWWRVQEDASGYSYYEKFTSNYTNRRKKATIIKLRRE